MFSKVFLGLIVGLGLTLSSCSKDPGEVVKGEDLDKNGEQGYVTFKVKTSLTTKSDQGTEVGLADESKVNTMSIVLYDPSTMKVAYNFALNNDAAGVVGTPVASPVTFTTKAQLVEKQTYKLLMLVNPGATVLGLTAVGKPFVDFNNAEVAVSADMSQLTGASADNFFMSNFLGLVDVTLADIYQTTDEAEAAPVDVDVERAVAKVMFDKSADFESPGAAVSEIFWAADMVNKSSYYMRHSAPTLSGAEEVGNRYNMYATDPNFKDHSWAYWDVSTIKPYVEPADPMALFHHTAAAGVVNDITVATLYQYVTENTMVAAEQYHDVTTRVIVKCVYAPTASSLGAPMAAGAKYYVYKGKYILTAAELADILDETIVIDPALSPELVDLLAYLEDAGNATFFSDFDGAGTTSIERGVMAFNATGINYYYPLIRHFENEQQPENMAYGRYGVVRNNVYKLTLNSISGPGTITLRNPDPDDPEYPDEDPDDNFGYISVKTTILPWQIRLQGVDL